MNYRTVVDPAARRHIRSWGLTDFVWVEVELHLRERLPTSPTSALRRVPSLFGGQGMTYQFKLIDPQNRMRVHFFRFQVFYGADEQTLFVTRGAHMTTEGL